jgi:hypothetical protein
MAAAGADADDGDPHRAAQHGLSGPAEPLPHAQAIQKSFGRHDLGDVRAHVGGAAAEGARQMGAVAFAAGRSVAFGESPDLRTAAHEAAHVVQQAGGVHLKNGVGESGDRYEQHADRVAEVVVGGGSAESLLDELAPSAGATAVPGAIQRIASDYKTTDALKQMTVRAFDRYTRTQVDWASSPNLDKTEKSKIRSLLELVRAKPILLTGLGDFTVNACVSYVGLGTDNNVDDALDAYSRGCQEAVQRSGKTVAIGRRAADLDDACKWGRAIQAMERSKDLGGAIINKIIPQEEGRQYLAYLVTNNAVQDFITYVELVHPILDATNGAEILSFVELKKETTDFAKLKGDLPTIRNLHRFELRTLKALATHSLAAKGDLPLTVILQSAFDHNGAFHRDAKMYDVVNRPNNVTLCVEGDGTLASFASQAEVIAKRYKNDGKIDQLMISGHGNYNSVELAGSKKQGAFEREKTEDVAMIGFGDRLLKALIEVPNSTRLLHAVLIQGNIKDKSPLEVAPFAATQRINDACGEDKSLAPKIIELLDSFDTKGAKSSGAIEKIVYALENYPQAAEAFHKILRSSKKLSEDKKAPFDGDKKKLYLRIASGLSEDPNLAAALESAMDQMRELPALTPPTKETAEFVDKILGLMKDDPSSRIVLNACLTASNTVKRELDPNPDVAATQIQSAIQKDPSLVFMLRTKVKERVGGGNDGKMQVDVRGANASARHGVGLVDENDPNKKIDIYDDLDKPLTAPDKLQYLENGVEPTGVLRASVETWAASWIAKDALWFDAVTRRLARTETSTDWRESVIRTLLQIVVGKAKSREQVTDAALMNKLQVIAGPLAKMKSASECSVGKLLGQIPDDHIDALFGGLLLTDVWQDADSWHVPLVANQLWMRRDGSKKSVFVLLLGALVAKSKKTGAVAPFVDLGVVGGLLDATLLPQPTKPVQPGPFLLALLFMESKGSGAPQLVKSFLTTVVKAGNNNQFPDDTNIDAILTGSAHSVLVGLGLAQDQDVPQVMRLNLDDQPNNLDLSHSGQNDFRVEPMTRRAKTLQETTGYDRPGGTAFNKTIKAGTTIHIIGVPKPTTEGALFWKSEVQWYAIEGTGGGQHTLFVKQEGLRLL